MKFCKMFNAFTSKIIIIIVSKTMSKIRLIQVSSIRIKLEINQVLIINFISMSVSNHWIIVSFAQAKILQAIMWQL